MNFRSKNTQIFFILIIFVLAFVFYPLSAKAGWIDDSLASVIGWVLKIIGYIFTFIASVFLALASYLAGFTINLNNTILDTNNVLVDAGWKIVRDITNLGFVLVIVIVAISTILRIQQYGAQKLLVRLIGAAIIVNFSLTIAGVFINFSQVITSFFFDKIGANPIEITTKLSGSFNVQKFFLSDQDPLPPDPSQETGGLLAFGTAIILSIAGLVFTTVFILIAAFTILVFALLMLYRYLVLSFLLVLSPIVWLFWVFPALKGQFTKWWNNFFKWVFFAPAASFFIYLAIAAAEKLSISTAAISDPSLFGFGDVVQTIIQQGAQMVVIAGTMIGGLIVAQKMGIAGAAGAMALGSKLSKGAAKWSGQKAGKIATAPLASAGGRKFIQGLQTNDTAAKLTLGLSRRAGNVLSTAAIKPRLKEQKQLEKKMEPYSDNEVARRFKSMNKNQQVAALGRLTKNKTLGLLKTEGGVDSEKLIANPKTKAAFESTGSTKGYDDLEKGLGYNAKMVEARDKAKKEAKRMGASDEQTKTMIETAVKPEADKFYGSYKKADWNNVSPNVLTHSEFGDSATENLLKRFPGSVSKILPKAKGNEIVQIMKKIEETKNQLINTAASELDEIIKGIEGPGFNIGAEGLMDIDKKIEHIKNKAPNRLTAEKENEHLNINKMQKTIDKTIGQAIFTGFTSEELETQQQI